MDSLKLIAKTNRKPADELAYVREQMKALAEREATLRNMMIADQGNRIGDEFKVVVYTVRTERIDTRRIKKELGLQFLRPFLKKAYDAVHMRVIKRDE